MPSQAPALADAITCADVLMMLGESPGGGVTAASLGRYIAAHGLAPPEDSASDSDAAGPSHSHRCPSLLCEAIGEDGFYAGAVGWLLSRRSFSTPASLALRARGLGHHRLLYAAWCISL